MSFFFIDDPEASVSIQQIGSVLTNSTDQSSYDFGTVSVPADGVVVVAFTARGNISRAVSSVSIGGTNGTLIADGSNATTKAAIGHRVVTAGTRNITVVLNGTNGSNAHATAAVYLITGYVSSTPSGSEAPSQVSAGAYSAAVNMVAGQVAVFAAVCNGTVSFTLSSATEVYDATLNSATSVHGFVSPTVAATPHTETATRSSGSDAGRAVMAVWS